MFTHITNLAQNRSITEAFGFYLFYTILLVGLSTFLGHYLVNLNIIDGEGSGFFEGGSVHTLVGAGWVMILSSLVLSAKKMTNDIMAVVIAIVGTYLAYKVDVMLGMVVVAYLTTMHK